MNKSLGLLLCPSVVLKNSVCVCQGSLNDELSDQTSYFASKHHLQQFIIIFIHTLRNKLIR